MIDIVKIPVLVSLAVVVAVLVTTMIWSMRTAPRVHEEEQARDHGKQPPLLH